MLLIDACHNQIRTPACRGRRSSATTPTHSGGGLAAGHAQLRLYGMHRALSTLIHPKYYVKFSFAASGGVTPTSVCCATDAAERHHYRQSLPCPPVVPAHQYANGIIQKHLNEHLHAVLWLVANRSISNTCRWHRLCYHPHAWLAELLEVFQRYKTLLRT